MIFNCQKKPCYSTFSKNKLIITHFDRTHTISIFSLTCISLYLYVYQKYYKVNSFYQFIVPLETRAIWFITTFFVVVCDKSWNVSKLLKIFLFLMSTIYPGQILVVYTIQCMNTPRYEYEYTKPDFSKYTVVIFRKQLS